MSSLRQKIYWKAPYFIKNWMASINARRLDRERYGPAFRQVLEEITERDDWSMEQFLEYQRRQLCSLVQHAAVRVPYYRKVFSEAGIDPKSITGPEDLQKLPILEKEVVRTHPENLVDGTLDKTKLLIAHTSGTTGTPLELYRDIRLNSAAFAYAQARWYSVGGMRKPLDSFVNVGVHMVVASNRRKPPFWLYNRRWKQLYMSNFHLAPDYLKYYVDELRRFKADYIENVPSGINAIAQYILDNDLEPVPFKACFTTSETLFDYQREAIKKAFGCRTYDQYGCGEQVAFAAECPAGLMHLSPEVGIVEVVDDNDRPVPIGQTGQLICTSLINRIQPFIRYRVGDIGALKTGRCSCGSPLPMLDRIEGRSDVFIITDDGRRIYAGCFAHIFYGIHGVAEAQVVQEDYSKFRLRIVAGNNYTEKDADTMMTNFTKRIGKADIKVELVEKIERAPSGKFKAVICNLPEGKR